MHQKNTQNITPMRITAIEMNALRRAQNIFLPAFKGEPLEKAAFFQFLPSPMRAIKKKFLKEEFTGEDGETKLLWTPRGKNTRIAFFGLGERKAWNTRKALLVPRRMVQFAKREKIKEFALPLSDVFGTEENHAARVATNAILADYDFNRYKETPKDGWPKVKNITLAVEKKLIRDVEQKITEGIIIGEETNRARDLANTPGGDMTPKLLAAEAKRAGKKWKRLVWVELSALRKVQQSRRDSLLWSTKADTKIKNRLCLSEKE